MDNLEKTDLLQLIDLTSLIADDNHDHTRARDRFLDAVDRLYLGGKLGIGTTNGRLEHADWATTVMLLKNATATEPARLAAARNALRSVHTTTFGNLEGCRRCAQETIPKFTGMLGELVRTEDGSGELPDPNVALGRIRLALRAHFHGHDAEEAAPLTGAADDD